MAGVFFGMRLMAQAPTVANQEILTTGMVGLINFQTARLNVLNLNPAAVATPAAVTNQPGYCAVQLEFFDSKNTLLNHSASFTLAPQMATALDQGFVAPVAVSAVASNATTAPAAAHQEIRGVVIANPVTSMGASGSSPCDLKVTLEIFDVSGNTLALTSDVSVVPPVAK